MLKNILVILLFAIFTIPMNAQNEIAIIPKPVNVKSLPGEFKITKTTVIVASTKESIVSANLFNQFIKQYYGLELPIVNSKKDGSDKIILQFKKESTDGSYTMKIDKSSVKIEGNESGIFYGFQSLKQLIKSNNKGILLVPCAEITDYPRYKWRGMHLDVCRHFITKDSVMKYIDYLSMYKMNVFHWHLTEDQGWRIEIKKYPKLAEIGGFRNGTLIGKYTTTKQKFDNIRYGGFYTQEEIKGVIQYAADRHITIVPEIEMPGHALAALTAYPQYSCTGGPFEVGKVWGVYDDVFCPKEETFVFLQDILNEVMDLFPSEYIHVGGDECPKTRWKNCPNCQKRIKDEGLKDEHQLQSYFITRIEKMVNARGKKVIGWDEILEGGLAPNAAVMSWRGTDGGIAAAKQSHYVVMSPGSHCYFDSYQGKPDKEPLAIGGYLTLQKVYSYEPTPKELPIEQQKYILGAQANMWTEYIPTFKQVEYMAIPRMCALAEVVWSPQTARDFPDFRNRLLKHFSKLDMLKVNYCKRNVDAK